LGWRADERRGKGLVGVKLVDVLDEEWFGVVDTESNRNSFV